MTEHIDRFTPGFGTMRTGCDFFPDAKPNPDQLISDLTVGTSVKVFGLRRTGKSSLLAETRDRLQAMGKNVIWVNLDKQDTLAKALAVILNSLHQGNSSGILARLRVWADNSNIVPAIFKSKAGALVAGAFDKYAKNFDEKYIETLSSQASRLLEAQDPDTKPIIIFDELTTLIKKTIDDSKDEEIRRVVGRMNSFLGLLRHLRTPDAGIAMAVSGSVSLDWLKQKYGIRSESINDCVNWNVEELDRQAAKNLLEMCNESEKQPNWNEQFTEDLLDFLPSFYPGVVQLAFRTISKISTPVVALDDTLREKIDEELWVYYLEQLNDYFQQFSTGEKRRIVRLFDVLAKEQSGKIGSGEAQEILEDGVMADGEMDGDAIISRLHAGSFLRITSNWLRFYSGLVPAWYHSKKRRKIEND